VNKGTSTVATHRRGPYGRPVQPSPGLQPPAPATCTASPPLRIGAPASPRRRPPRLNVDFPAAMTSPLSFRAASREST
jgi:hypothetical protein